MTLPPEPETPRQREPSSGGTVATRIWDAVRRLAAMTEQLRTLEKEDAHLRAQLTELARIVVGLSNDVHEILGQMKAIERRFDDRDKLVEATMRLRLAEEMQKLRAELIERFSSGDTSRS